jgi:HK97 family phage major capsid protein
LNGELTYAVEVAIEDALINGPSAGLIVGFLDTSGVLLQAFVTGTEMLTTLANAINLVERGGVPVTGIVMNFQDWLSVTTLKDSYGRFLAGAEAPVETTAQRIWGRPVVLSVKMPASEALVGASAGRLRCSWRMVVRSSRNGRKPLSPARDHRSPPLLPSTSGSSGQRPG